MAGMQSLRARCLQLALPALHAEASLLQLQAGVPLLARVCQLLQCRGMAKKRMANEVRPGNVLELNGKMMQVLQFQHTQGAGRQMGNVQVSARQTGPMSVFGRDAQPSCRVPHLGRPRWLQLTLRDVRSRAKHQAKLRPSDRVDVVDMDDRPMRLLYEEGGTVHCMDPAGYEQVEVERALFGEQAAFLREGLDVVLHCASGEPLAGARGQRRCTARPPLVARRGRAAARQRSSLRWAPRPEGCATLCSRSVAAGVGQVRRARGGAAHEGRDGGTQLQAGRAGLRGAGAGAAVCEGRR